MATRTIAIAVIAIAAITARHIPRAAADSDGFTAIDPSDPHSPRISVQSIDPETGHAIFFVELDRGVALTAWDSRDYTATVDDGILERSHTNDTAPALVGTGTSWKHVANDPPAPHPDRCASDRCSVYLHVVGRLEPTAATAPASLDCEHVIPIALARAHAPTIRSPRLEPTVIAACRDDHWADATVRCLDAARTDAALQACHRSLTAPQLRGLTAAMSVSIVQPARRIEMIANPIGLPAECSRYETLTTRLLDCDGLSDKLKDSLSDGMGMLAKSWSRLRVIQPFARRPMAGGCTQGADAMQQLGEHYCGW